MEIRDGSPNGRSAWNRFVRSEYPPIGSFMHTWEWGEFQEALGRTVARGSITERSETLALFTLVRHRLPLGLSYGYVPRGPAIKQASEAMAPALFQALRTWVQDQQRDLAFLRLEPPLIKLPVLPTGFVFPSYYVQPRYNLAVPLDVSEEKILAGFHPSTRSNIRRAEERGVTIAEKPGMTEADYREFFAMTGDTILRNSGKNAYPSAAYFHALAKTLPVLQGPRDPERLYLKIYFGYQNGEPAAAHFVLFFDKTATYLYGASFSDKLRSKVTTYLHWAAMKDAKRLGCAYYDLGGIDETKWPTLTNFKRQFRGREFSYIGNIDIPLKPLLYRLYNLSRNFRKS